MLCGCRGGDDYAPALERAEALLDSMPDTSMAIIRSIPRDEIASRRVRALRDLLEAEAEYKCYIENPEDSLLAEAVGYFRDSGDEPLLMRALYQQSLKEYYRADYTAGIVSALECLDIAEALDNTEYLARINEHIGDIYCMNVDQERALKYTGAAIRYYEQCGKIRNMHFALVDKALELSNHGLYEESLNLLDSARELFPQDDSVLWCYATEARLDPLHYLNRHEEALLCSEKLIRMAGNLFQPDKRQLMDVAIDTKNIPAARNLLEEIRESTPDWEADSRILRLLVNLYTLEGKADSALVYADKRIQLEHKGAVRILRQSVVKAQGDVFMTRAERLRIKLLERDRIFLVITVLFMIAAVIAALFYRHKRKKYMEEIGLRVREIRNLFSRIEILLSENNNLTENIGYSQNAIESLNKSLVDVKGNFNEIMKRYASFIQDRVRIINKVCCCFYDERNTADPGCKILYDKVVPELRKIRSAENIDELELLLNITCENIVDKLKNAVPNLKDDDRVFVILSYLKFDYKAICVICDMEAGNYYNKRKRIKERIRKNAIDIYNINEITRF